MYAQVMLPLTLISVLGTGFAQESGGVHLDDLIAGNEGLLSAIPAFEARYTVVDEYGDLGADTVAPDDQGIHARFRRELDNARAVTNVHIVADGNTFIATQSVTFYDKDDEVLRHYVRRAASDGASMRIAMERPNVEALYEEFDFPAGEDSAEAMERLFRRAVSFDLRDYWGKSGDFSLWQIISGSSASMEWEIEEHSKSKYVVRGRSNGILRTSITIDAGRDYMMTEAKGFVAGSELPRVALTVEPAEKKGVWYPKKIVAERSPHTSTSEVESFKPIKRSIAPEETTWDALGIDVAQGVYVRHHADGTVERRFPDNFEVLAMPDE